MASGKVELTLSQEGKDMEAAVKAPERPKTLEEEGLGKRLGQVAMAVTPLAFMAFGGPSAHLAIMHDQFITRLKWLTPDEFNDLLALGMFLPGPTSTELCIAVGTYRAGVLGGLLAFFLWSLPSFVVLTAAGLGMQQLKGDRPPDWMLGLAPAAIVLIFLAFYKLSQKVVTDKVTASLTMTSACVTLLVQGSPQRLAGTMLLWLLPVMLVVGGLVNLGSVFFKKWREERARQRLPSEEREGGERRDSNGSNGSNGEVGGVTDSPLTSGEGDTYSQVHVPRWWVFISLGCMAAFLLFLLSRSLSPHPSSLGPHFTLFSHLFIMGLTIYGGGQVVLPMLISVAVSPGWITMQQFLQGYALAQLLPGPLFNISAYIGAAYLGLSGAVVGWLALFLPGLLLVIALLPLWHRFRKIRNVKPFLAGVNATGLGLILAVGVSIYLQVIHTPADVMVSLISLGLSVYGGHNSLVAVLCGGVAGFLFSNTCMGIGQRPYTRY